MRKAWPKEEHIAGNLHHPYIVDIFDAGFGDDAAYLAMEYLPNGTLEPYTKAEHLKPLAEVLEMVHKCASAAKTQIAAAQHSRPGEAKLYDRLRALPLLKPLNDAQLWELLRISSWRNLPAGSMVMREGGEARSCYLLLNAMARRACCANTS